MAQGPGGILVPKRNYTKAQAVKACFAIRTKLLKLHEDGYITAKTYVPIEEKMARIRTQIKRM